MKPSVPAVTSSSHSPIPVPSAARISWRRDSALDLLLAQRLDGLLGQGGRLVDGFDVVVAHARWFLRGRVTGRSGGRGCVTYGMTNV